MMRTTGARHHQRFIAAPLGLALALFSSVGSAADFCAPLPPPTGDVIDVDPSQVAQLPDIVAGAPAGSTIRLAAGLYNLDGLRLIFTTPDLTLRSATGNRDDVILDGNLRDGAYVSPEIISIFASNITIADLTLMRAYDHPIHVTPPPGINITGTLIYNVRVVDPGQQAIKINPTDAVNSADNGTIACSLIELSDEGRGFIRDNCYTGGIDAHRAQNWRVADNTIQGFWCEAGLAEHGIHFWRASEDTLVERNRVFNNARGIGFGLGADPSGGHTNGIIRNNFVVVTDDRVFASGAGFDVGIGLEQAANAKVLHNSVVSTAPPFSSIEWRWSGTTATITNNIASHNLRERDGATATLGGNLPNAPLSLFVDVGGGDLHLLSTATLAIDQGVDVPPGDADEDIDGDSRLVTARDIGADEFEAGSAPGR